MTKELKRKATNDVRYDIGNDSPATKELKTQHARTYKFTENNSELTVELTTRTWKFHLDPALQLNKYDMITMVTEHLLTNWDTYKQYITTEDTSVFFQKFKTIDSLTHNEKLLYISDLMLKAQWFGKDQNTIDNIHKVIADKMELDADIELAINTAIKLTNIIQEIEVLKNQPTLEALIKLSNDYPHSIKNLHFYK